MGRGNESAPAVAQRAVHRAAQGRQDNAVSRRGGIILKSAREIELMRQSGAVVRRVLNRMQELARPGATTAALDAEAERMIREVGGTPLFKGVTNPQARFAFPASICASVNEELVHGIPNDRPLRDGDILSVDCGVRLNGYCGDAAVTIPIGTVSAETRRLLEVTSGTLDLAIELMRPGGAWSDVARRMQEYVENHGFSVIREFVGHGIGRQMHEEPKVPNFWDRKQRGTDFRLSPGLTLAVEPMVSAGTKDVEYKGRDRWVVVTRDRKYSAHFEHTIAITERGVDVLTR